MRATGVIKYVTFSNAPSNGVKGMGKRPDKGALIMHARPFGYLTAREVKLRHYAYAPCNDKPLTGHKEAAGLQQPLPFAVTGALIKNSV